jgi:protein-S-isoprenylcysteine O-methyltransferase Ste14
VQRERGPKIRFPPPAAYLVLFLIGLLLERVLRIRIVGDARAPLLTVFGVALVGLGCFVALWGIVTFRRHRTSVLPFRPASALVETGPYRFTRNPMYVGMTTAYVGAALALNVVWPLLILPIVLYLIVRLVVKPEEEYLAAKFGVEYARFTQRVRRWL